MDLKMKRIPPGLTELYFFCLWNFACIRLLFSFLCEVWDIKASFQDRYKILKYSMIQPLNGTLCMHAPPLKHGLQPQDTEWSHIRSDIRNKATIAEYNPPFSCISFVDDTWLSLFKLQHSAQPAKNPVSVVNIPQCSLPSAWVKSNSSCEPFQRKRSTASVAWSKKTNGRNSTRGDAAKNKMNLADFFLLTWMPDWTQQRHHFFSEPMTSAGETHRPILYVLYRYRFKTCISQLFKMWVIYLFNARE